FAGRVGVRCSLHAFDSRREPLTRRSAPTSPRKARGEAEPIERARNPAMATDSGKKLFVGPRFRRIRQQLGLSQTPIAERLGTSPSYINLIERNQRPVTAQILLRLAE